MTQPPRTAAGRALLVDWVNPRYDGDYPLEYEDDWPGAGHRRFHDAILAIEAQAAAPDALREAHEPGEHHRYRIECEVCGQRGTVNLSVEPQRAPDYDQVLAELRERADES